MGCILPRVPVMVVLTGGASYFYAKYYIDMYQVGLTTL